MTGEGRRGRILSEILYCGFGFTLTRRVLYETMKRQLRLPVCNRRFKEKPLAPYFAPLIEGEGEQAWYLGEDYSFCERARRCSFGVMADTTIRLWHVGSYRFGWEDAGRDVERFNDYTFEITDAAPVGRGSARASNPARKCTGSPCSRATSASVR